MVIVCGQSCMGCRVEVVWYNVMWSEGAYDSFGAVINNIIRWFDLAFYYAV